MAKAKDENWPEMIATAAKVGNWKEALRVAVKFKSLGEQGDAIRDAHSAVGNPQFYRDIGKDPEKLIAAGIEALKVRFGVGG